MKHRHRALGVDYLDHQQEFFGGQPALEHTHDKFCALRRRVAEYARNGGQTSALDVATGYGFQARALLDRGFEQVVAVDVVPERIEHGRRLFPRGIDFRVMDATNLEFPDASFDCATVSAALHDMPPAVKRRTLAELARVVRRTVVLLEPRTFRNPAMAAFYGTLGSWLDESLYFHEYVRDDLAGAVAEHGLRVVRSETVWYGFLDLTVCVRDK
jgi:SAM-dependent methyltransferase